MSEQVSSIINSAGVGFGLAVQPVDPDPNIVGDEFLVNIVQKCKFHTAESIPTKTCVICKILDGSSPPNILGEGTLDLPTGYIASTTLMVPITASSPGSNAIQGIHGVEINVCEPPPSCECINPTTFTVRYDGPQNGVTVKIFKTVKKNAPSELVFTVPGTFNSGNNITIKSTDWGQNTVNPDTVYAFYKKGNSIGFVKIHTSCSQPLFIDQEFFFKKGTSVQIKLKVISGFDPNGSSAIPDSTCPFNGGNGSYGSLDVKVKSDNKAKSDDKTKNGDKSGYDKDGYDREGYDKSGYDKKGYDKNGKPKVKGN